MFLPQRQVGIHVRDGVGRRGSFEWFANLFSQTESVARAVIILAVVAALELVVGSIRVLEISLKTAASDAPSVSYATVYPLTMPLRVLSAQAMIPLLMR